MARIVLNEYLVQFGGVPYIKCTLAKMEDNSERMSGFFYGVMQTLRLKSPEQLRDYWARARDKFNSNYRYNDLRDEIDDFKTSAEYLSRKKSDMWVQSNFSFDELEMFA